MGYWQSEFIHSLNSNTRRHEDAGMKAFSFIVFWAGMNRVPLGRDRTFRFLKTHLTGLISWLSLLPYLVPRSYTEVYPQR